MKRIAQIVDNTIYNVSLAEDDWIIPDGFMLESDAIKLGIPYSKKTSGRKIWNNKTDFWNEFSIQEKIIISNSNNQMLKFFLTELSIWDGEVWSDDERVITGLNILLSENIISQERIIQITG
jgi:hypothetical protein